MNKRIRGLILPIPLLLAGQAAQALGLGELKVESALDQPLKGQIRLILSAGESLDKLRVKMAAADDYERVGLDPTLVPPTIKLAVKNDNLGPFVEITSSQPVNEPIVSLLLEADWPKGRLLREYTLLLDPPSYAPVATVEPARLTEPDTFDAVVQEHNLPQEEAPVEQTMAVESAPAESTPPVAEAEQTSREFPVEDTALPLADTVEVNAGNTLWSIASQNRQPNVSVQQMMVAILRANPEAFLDGNMNKLKKGSLLRIPSADEVADISRQEALAEVASQSQQWVNYQDKAWDVMPSAYQTETTTEPAMETATATQDYQLDLVPPAAETDQEKENTTASGTAAKNPTYAELALAREDVATLKQEKNELASRIQELESIVNDQQAVLQMKDADLAQLQQQLASLNEKKQVLESSMQKAEENLSSIAQQTEDGQETAETPDTQANTVAANDDLAATEAAESAAPTMSEGVEVTMNESDEADSAPEAHDVWDQTDKIATAGETSESIDPNNQAVSEEPVLVTDETQSATTEEPSITATETAVDSTTTSSHSWWQKALDWITSNPLYAGGGALLLLLLGLLPRFLRKEETAEDSTGGSFLDSIAQRKEPTEAVATDVDIDELLERIEENPDDVDLLYQAALHYYGEDDKDHFESMAEELYGRLADPNHPKWQEIAELGQKIAPENALFGLASLSDDPEAFEDSRDTQETEPQVKTAIETENDSSIDEAEDSVEQGEENEFSFDLDEFISTDGSGKEQPIADGGDKVMLQEAETLAAGLGTELTEGNEEAVEELDEVGEEALTTEELLESAESKESDLDLEDRLDTDLESDLESELESNLGTDLEKELGDLELDGDLDLTAEAPVIDLSDDLNLDDEEDLMDFDFGEEALSQPPEEAHSESDSEDTMKEEKDEQAADEEAMDLGFNLDDIVPEGDAVATKLDLARAYYEMGDVEGARIMLDEVEEEGNAEQQAEARKLRDEMGSS